jgi:hypothetical protein
MLTLAEVTPGLVSRARCSEEEQPAQVIPVIRKV